MSRENRTILNQFFEHCPENTVLTSFWLKNQGINEKLTWRYVQSGWLTALAPKAYCKPNTRITWTSAIVALQQQLKLPVWVGGKTALQLLGKAHYLPLENISQVEVFGLARTTLPTWLKKITLWKTAFKITKTSLFKSEIFRSVGLTTHEINGVAITISAPERAIMEIFYSVKNDDAYAEALLLMENLTNLRAQVAQTLLENCQSFKVKRLFLFAAEKFQHEWLNDLELKKINLGKGKRKIGSGGNYQEKYQLSVPQIRE